MYVPITSEITIKSGALLREIATGETFIVKERVQDNPDVSGEDNWIISPTGAWNGDRDSIVLRRQEMSEKYFVDDEKTVNVVGE